MQKRNIYICGVNTVVLCIDDLTACEPAGRIYHRYSDEAIPFRGIEQIIPICEGLYDSIKDPFPSNEDRSFFKKKRRTVPCIPALNMKGDSFTVDELLEKRGAMTTFIIHTQQRQHNTWQGRAVMVERDESIFFQSILELFLFMVKEEFYEESKENHSCLDDHNNDA